MSVTSILVIYAGSVALPALTTVPAFATTDTTDNNNNDTMLFLIDVIQCFPNIDINNNPNGNNNNDDEQFSEDVKVCLNDVICQYFNNDNNLDNNNYSQDNDNISSDDNNNIEPSSQET